MEQLPKIIGQRLQAVSRAETHPDANLLTAFAEKSLLPREQAQILEHLAGCADCREVVAHAQPEEVLQKVAVAAAAPIAPRRSAWFSAAVIRWGALAACVVVVGAVVISRTQFEKRPLPVSSNNEPAVVAKTESQPQPAPSVLAEEKDALGAPSRLKAPPSVKAKRDFDELATLDKQRAENTMAKDSVGERRQAEQAYSGPAVHNDSPVSAVGGLTASRAAAAQTIAAAPQEDAKSTKKEFSADKAMKPQAMPNEVLQAQAVPVAAPPPPPPAAKPLADSRSSSVQESVQSHYNQKDGYVAGGAIGSFAKRMVIPMWQLSEDGKLIKSLDHGQNWQPVPVGDKAVFRALCVTVHEIWVGGAQGTLFYSSDEGQQWEQVKPVAKGQTLTADITAIEFKDSKHGKVTTVDHQTWTTNDGGHDWKVETR